MTLIVIEKHVIGQVGNVILNEATHEVTVSLKFKGHCHFVRGFLFVLQSHVIYV